MKIVMHDWELDVNEDDWNRKGPGSIVRLYSAPKFVGKMSFWQRVLRRLRMVI